VRGEVEEIVIIDYPVTGILAPLWDIAVAGGSAIPDGRWDEG
jgi:hypothetical protein